MKYIDKGVIYIPINKNTTKEKMELLKAPHVEHGKTVVFLRGGSQNMKSIISNLLKASL